MFKLLRMQNIRILDSPQSRKHDVEKVRHEMDTRQDPRPHIIIKLQGEKSIKSKCLEYLHGTVTEEYPDGSFMMTAAFPKAEYYWYSTLLGFGTKVRVLEPLELIERICNDCMAIAALYKNRTL